MGEKHLDVTEGKLAWTFSLDVDEIDEVKMAPIEPSSPQNGHVHQPTYKSEILEYEKQLKDYYGKAHRNAIWRHVVGFIVTITTFIAGWIASSFISPESIVHLFK